MLKEKERLSVSTYLKHRSTKISMNDKHILVIAFEKHWRDLCAQALEQAQYDVQPIHSYDTEHLKRAISRTPPDLVVLGCVRAGPRERTLIRKIVQIGLHLLVLCTSLSVEEMRSIFRDGADDVAEKPYDPDSIVNLVNQTLTYIAPA